MLNVESVARLIELVEHVQRDDNRFAGLDDLGYKIKISLETGRVDDDDNSGHVLREDFSAGDMLFDCVGTQAVSAGQIDERYPGIVDPNRALLALYCYTWVVAYVLS